MKLPVCVWCKSPFINGTGYHAYVSTKVNEKSSINFCYDCHEKLKELMGVD